MHHTTTLGPRKRGKSRTWASPPLIIVDLFSESADRSHAGIHSPGWEEPCAAAQLPTRFPQVSVREAAAVALIVQQRVKYCFVAGTLWRTLRHFSMPVTTRWLLQNTTARPFKSLRYFSTWNVCVCVCACLNVFGVNFLTCDEDVIPQQTWMGGWVGGRWRKNPGKSSHSGLNKLIFFSVESCWLSSPSVCVLQHGSLVPLTLTKLRHAGVSSHFFVLFFPRSKFVL